MDLQALKKPSPYRVKGATRCHICFGEFEESLSLHGIVSRIR